MGDAVEPTVLTLGASGVRPARMSEAGAASGTDMAALARRMTAVETRLAALEARPEEVAHFAASAALPAIAAAASFTVRLTGLVPERAGDAVRKGEQVDVRADLPSGLTMGVPLATADGVVSVPLKASLAVAAGAAIPWSVTVLR